MFPLTNGAKWSQHGNEEPVRKLLWPVSFEYLRTGLTEPGHGLETGPSGWSQHGY